VSQTATRFRQVVDWSAAIWAGIISGVLFLIANVVLSAIQLGSPWIIFRVLASVVLGSSVLPPPTTFTPLIFLVGLVTHLVLSVIFAGILAVIIHRWGLVVGIVGGAIFGLALYAINFYTFSYFFPWFFAFKSWMMLVSHLVFGAAAGGIYEALEVEEFVPVE